MTVVSTEPIDNQVERAIAHHPHLSRSHLDFKSRNGRVTLKGKVGTFFEKQMAQEALRNIDGVSEIENELTVDWMAS